MSAPAPTGPLPSSDAAAPGLAHELSTRYLKPLLDICREKNAEADLAPLLARFQVSLDELRDQTNWVSLRFCEALVDWLAERVPAPEIIARTTRDAFSPAALGFLYPLLRAFGSPGVGYAALPRITPQLNKVSRVSVLASRRGYLEIEYRPANPQLRERSPLMCDVRRAHLTAGPTLWGLPEARVEEVECQARGGERCLYRLRWAERAGWLLAVIGVALGGAAGALLAGGVATFPALALAAAGALAGRLWATRRQLRELHAFNDEQRGGLEDAVAAADRRFVELQKAKAEVDVKVEERTAELRHTGAELATSLQQLEQLGKVKDEFLANVSHELRTPLTLIIAPLEELIAGRAPAERGAEYMRAMHRSAVRLNSLVTDLLELARIQAGHLRLAVAETDPGELVGGIAGQFQALAANRGVTLSVEPDAGPVPAGKVVIDPGRMEFVFTNLMSNAMKFTPAGGRVTVRVRGEADAVCIDVEDTGAGIPAELQGRVFERFSRFESASVPGAAGAGIGLALVKELCELHGGSVSLRSAPGQGTCVTVRLQRGRDHLRPEILDRRRVDVPVPFGRRTGDTQLPPGAASSAAATAAAALLAAAPAGAAEAATAPAAPATALATAPPDAPRVLVVEDNDDMRAFVCTILSQRYRVLEAPDGRIGLETARREHPDVVVSDLMMPGLNGYEMCRALKQDAETRSIPVLLVTAKKDTQWALEGFQAGADDYLSKPFNAQELLARVDVHVRLGRLMRERAQNEKLAVLGTLAAGMAHEVRNPASAILAGLPRVRRLLDRPDVPEGARQMVDVAIDCAQRISRLVGDLLEVGQPQREGAAPCDPHEGLEATLRLLAHRASARIVIRRRYEFAGHVPARAAQVNQIFLNLVDNALRAVGETGTIEVETRAEAGGVAVTIADSGPGVPPALAERIFDPFFTTRDVGQGTGLGLHLSRRIAQEHGGRLELISGAGAEGNTGARFQLWLPGGTDGTDQTTGAAKTQAAANAPAAGAAVAAGESAAAAKARAA
ncbi:MAG TPA: ATP-binding protein [Myxococcota bacterium]|nr:ATP-binding protein [Myxococcota bacterium]